MSGAEDVKSCEPKLLSVHWLRLLYCLELISGMNLAAIRKFCARENEEHTSLKVGHSYETRLFSSLDEFLNTRILFRETAKLWDDEKDESYGD